MIMIIVIIIIYIDGIIVINRVGVNIDNNYDLRFLQKKIFFYIFSNMYI